jgi:hypothetical protein
VPPVAQEVFKNEKSAKQGVSIVFIVTYAAGHHETAIGTKICHEIFSVNKMPYMAQCATNYTKEGLSHMVLELF